MMFWIGIVMLILATVLAAHLLNQWRQDDS